MINDLAERLREAALNEHYSKRLLREAADRIEQLEAEQAGYDKPLARSDKRSHHYGEDQ